MKHGAIVLITLFMVNVSFSQEDYYENLFEKGNNAYVNGNIDSALAAYNEVLNARFESAELYYNLGNTYFKLNQLPEAILYYEKALKLNPTNQDILHNITVANELITDKMESVPKPFVKRLLSNLSHIFSMNTWALSSLVSFILVIGCAFAYFFVRKAKKKMIYFIGIIVSLVLFGFSYLMANIQYKDLKHQTTAIVFEEAITGYSEPSENSNKLFVIHEGLKVKLGEEVGEWIQITLPDGNVGWTLSMHLEKI